MRIARRAARLLGELWRSITAHRVLDLSAQLSFYAVLGLFPFAIFLATVIAFLPLRGLTEQIAALIQAFAPVDVAPVLEAALRNVVSGASRKWLLVGLGGALLTASVGVSSLTAALNHAYGVTETRSWLRVRIRAVAITAVAALLIIGAVTALLLGSRFGELAATYLHGDHLIGEAWHALRWPATAAAMAALLAFLYYACPNVSQPLARVLPGAILGVPLWIGVSLLFNIYVVHAGRYHRVYGALGTGVVLLLWLQLSSLIVLVGGELNALLARRRPLRPRREPDQIGRWFRGAKRHGDRHSVPVATGDKA